MKNLFMAFLVSLCIILSGCGGGSSDDGGGNGAPPQQTETSQGESNDTVTKVIKGTAAAGSPIVGQVVIRGSLGVSKSAPIGVDGSYSVDVTGLTAPYRLRAEGTVGGRTYKLHSYAETSDLDGNVNITPFTDLIIANVAGQIAESYFDSDTPSNLDPVALAAQEEALQNKLKDIFDALGIDSAINLLNSTFSADHTGLDAALDAVNIEVDTGTNIATITNLISNTSITDDIANQTDNSDTLVVTDSGTLPEKLKDTQAIINLLKSLAGKFSNGLPTSASIKPFFSSDFMDKDRGLDLFLTDITTDPMIVGLAFNNIVVEDLTATSAKLTFSLSIGGVSLPEPGLMLVVKEQTASWLLRGDQKIVDYYFHFHCSHWNNSESPGPCGINAAVDDNDFTNNGTENDAPIASAKVSIIDGMNGTTVKDVVYLGTPSNQQGGTPGDLKVYNSADWFNSDYKQFGTEIGEINPSIFVPGDRVQFEIYSEELDLSDPMAPAIAADAVPVDTFSEPLLFAPSTTGLYPTATEETLSAIAGFTLGNDLTMAWNLAEGTIPGEVHVEISDSQSNRLSVWLSSSDYTNNTVSISSTDLSAASASGAGLDPNAITYELMVRIYSDDIETGQLHSRRYTATIPGPGIANPIVGTWLALDGATVVFKDDVYSESGGESCPQIGTYTVNDSEILTTPTSLGENQPDYCISEIGKIDTQLYEMADDGKSMMYSGTDAEGHWETTLTRQ